METISQLKSTLHVTVRSWREICIDFICWGMTTVSVIWNKGVSTLRLLQYTVKLASSPGHSQFFQCYMQKNLYNIEKLGVAWGRGYSKV